jgi:DNA mismatch repair protein MSH5
VFGKFYTIYIKNGIFTKFLHRVGISYYDSSIRQLHVLEVWEDGSSDFPLIDLGMPCLFVGMAFISIIVHQI